MAIQLNNQILKMDGKQLINTGKMVLYALLLAMGAVLFSQTFYGPRKFNMAGLRQNAQDELDSMTKRMREENARDNKINMRLDSLINSKTPLQALPMVDSIMSQHRNPYEHYGLLHYKGKIYFNNNQLDSSLFYYNLSLAYGPDINSFLGRGELYTKMGRLDDALKDYKEAFIRNYDFSINVGDAFSLLGQTDSARYYYNFYLEHYPNDTVATQKLRSMEGQPRSK